jgi:hypothetical protein
MKSENRAGLELVIEDVAEGVERLTVTNWPGGLACYTNQGTKAISEEYAPGVARSTIGNALPKDADIEPAVHTIVAMSRSFGEFVGFDAQNLANCVDFLNHYIPVAYRVSADPTLLAAAAQRGYLMATHVEGQTVYFPTEKAVRPMCNTWDENAIYVIALHTEIGHGIGHHTPPEDID